MPWREHLAEHLRQPVGDVGLAVVGVDGAEEDVRRRLAHEAGEGVGPRVAVEAAEGRVGGVAADAAGGEGRRVGEPDMTVGAEQEHRPAGGSGIQLVTRRVAAAGT